MQNTRLNTLIDRLGKQFSQWVQNPWRRMSLIIISLLVGAFLASAIITTTGQWASLDITLAVLMVALVELINWLKYRRVGQKNLERSLFVRTAAEQSQLTLDRQPLWITLANSLKLGLMYGLFLEAFKLGS